MEEESSLSNERSSENKSNYEDQASLKSDASNLKDSDDDENTKEKVTCTENVDKVSKEKVTCKEEPIQEQTDHEGEVVLNEPANQNDHIDHTTDSLPKDLNCVEDIGTNNQIKDDMENLDQFTDPEILEPIIAEKLHHKSLGESKSEHGYSKAEWKTRQVTEPIYSSSSDEESCSSTEQKRVKRRKKRPRSSSPASMERHKKMQEIQSVLSSSPLDIEKLRELAVGDGGLVKDELRRKAWPRLMMIEHMEVTPKPTLDVVKAHKDYSQVVLDVNRSLKRFPPGIDDDYRLVLMDQLTTLIIRVLIKHPDLHYYQGFHDVAITFLLVMGEDVGFELVEKLAVSHLCDFMKPTMEKTTYYLTYLYPILRRSDTKLYDFLINSGVGTVFCLPWLITWFAHTLSDYRNVVRLYDFFLASPYLMPMYIATAIVLQKKQEILSGDCDMAMQHFILSQVPDSLPFEEILVEANSLHDQYPPDSLQEEVDEFIKKKNEEDALEKKRLLDKRKRFEAARRGEKYREMMRVVCRYNPIPPAQTKMIIKVAFFAVTAYFATSLYSYYSESPWLFPFSTRQ
ncbi:hypothetical protein SK128_026341 [Halocaridina rubra]|uniref:Rab-GAP TBC domain-containing protein n=1 Tax=Halocaridina rubra TaxID=373956 RepID=A0AAN9AG22_HALRR